MRKGKRHSLTGVLVLALSLAAGRGTATPFVNEPGARSAAMGGAFLAVADDASAVWHNPAGLVGREKAELAVDWSRGVGFGPKGKARSAGNGLLVGGSGSTQSMSSGLFYIRPYRVDYTLADAGRSGTASGKVSQTFDQLSVPYAVNLHSYGLKLGLTADITRVSVAGNDLAYRTAGNDLRTFPRSTTEKIGLAGSLGLLWDLYRGPMRERTVRLGGVLRTSATSRGRLHPSEKAVKEVLRNRPKSLGLGVAWEEYLSALRHFTASLQLDIHQWATNAAWGAKAGYRTLKAGVEYAHVKDFRATVPLELSYRAGVWRSRPFQGSSYPFWPTERGISLGFGVGERRDFQLDIGVRYSSYSGAGFGGDAFTFQTGFVRRY
ncbi:hypothetical protein [Thiohalorhabdus methylotrophus]|uniref:Long-chain fatty acid transport protein n=1 Tax=Thiohalorhabdus methylotrophus TaxID=3242694 RepID=A0ABV4TSI5_9GAMM